MSGDDARAMTDERLGYAREHVEHFKYQSDERGFMAGLLDDLLIERDAALADVARYRRALETTLTHLKRYHHDAACPVARDAEEVLAGHDPYWDPDAAPDAGA